jgi:hypothetical protein
VVPRLGYTSVSNLLAEIQLTSTDMSAYQPVRTPPPTCSSTHTLVISAPPPGPSGMDTIELSSEIPPFPDEHLCKCMMDSLQCITREDDYGKHMSTTQWLLSHNFSTIVDEAERGVMEKHCPQNETWCLGSLANPNTGRYGSLSVCNASHRASWVLNQASSSSTNVTESCSGNGGLVQRPVASNLQSTGCKSYLQQIGRDGTEKITEIPRLQDLENKIVPTEKQKSASLSTMPIIAITVSLIILAVLSTIGLIWWRRRRLQKRALDKSLKPSLSPTTGDDEDSFRKAELPDNRKQIAEVGDTARVELASENRVESGGEQVVEAGGEQLVEADPSQEVFELATAHNERVEMEAPLWKLAASRNI